MKIRTKLTALFLLSAATGVLGTSFFILRAYVTDKKNYVTELNSTAAPGIAALIDEKFDRLAEELQVLGGLTKNGELPRNPTTVRVINALASRFTGISTVEIRQGKKRIAELQFTPATATLPAIDSDSFHPEAMRFTLAREGGRLVAAREIGGFLYLLQLQPEFFLPSLTQSNALRTALVGADGAVWASATPDFPRVELPLSALATSRIVAQEMPLSDHSRVLAGFSPVPGLRDGYAVVFAPAVSLNRLIRPFLNSSILFLILVLASAALLGLLFAREIARPIEELTLATDQVGSGHLNINLRLRPRNEIGKLMQAFAKMVRDLGLREAELKRANDDLVRSESLSAVGRFSAGIAHEVKNPLSSILGYAQLLQQKQQSAPNTDSFSPYVGYILDETRRANKIITELLMFSRQKPPVLTALPIEAIIRKAYEMLKPTADAAAIELRLEIPEGAMLIRHDPDQIYQVLLNLVQNSIQAIANAEVTARRISLRLTVDGTRAHLLIEDTGPGIPPENLTKIFEPFFSTKEIGKGSGLGLSMCHSIIAQHGGAIVVRSTVGTGTTFDVELPVVV